MWIKAVVLTLVNSFNLLQGNLVSHFELLIFFRESGTSSKIDEISETFDVFDTDGDGVICAKDLSEVTYN